MRSRFNDNSGSRVLDICLAFTNDDMKRGKLSLVRMDLDQEPISLNSRL